MFLSKELSFKGHSYKVAYVEPVPYHASWFSFDDESDVRDRDWDIKPGDVVFDVGAAYGSYTLTALALGASHVFAWSPQGEPGLPQEREFLYESLRLNGWEDRVTIMSDGVYDKTGYLNASTQEFSENPLPESNDVIRVEALDDWRNKNGLYQHAKSERFWMKLDVEGAEVEVLRGASALITELKPTILVENHIFKNNNLAREVRYLLERKGYIHVSTHPHHSVSHSVYVPR